MGIVGLGRVGQQVAKRLTGFDTNTIYYDIVDIPGDIRQRLNAEPVEFDELLRESDFVCLHVPLTQRTRGMISDRELALMKPTSYLINACRGPVVDEKALHRALVDGQIAGAGLDVLEQEPTPTDNPLFDLENVLITPHLAGTSEETNQRAADFAYGNIARVLSGQVPRVGGHPRRLALTHTHLTSRRRTIDTYGAWRSGSARGLGPRGRRFEPGRPDHSFP